MRLDDSNNVDRSAAEYVAWPFGFAFDRSIILESRSHRAMFEDLIDPLAGKRRGELAEQLSSFVH